MHSLRRPLILFFTFLLGCLAADAAPAGAPPPPEVYGTKDLGRVQTNPIISGRDGAYSTRVGGVSVWVYGDTALTSPGADGGTWRHNTLSWTHDLYAPDRLSGFTDHADAIGVPAAFLPLTQDEIDYNARHHGDNCQEQPCNYEYGLWPGALQFDPEGGRILYTYSKMLLGPGAWNFTSMGTGIAVGQVMPPGPSSRPIVNPGSAEPTLLFEAGEPGFVNAAFTELVGGVPTIYFYDSSGGDGFTKPMHLARVPAASVLDRSAWRFYAGNGVWSDNVADAAVIFDGADQLSVHWSSFLGRYLAIYIQPLSTNAVARVADHPEGPWSDTVLLFQALTPADGGMDYCGMAHLELQRDGGRFEYVSYVRDTAPFQSERRLVEIEFKNRIEADGRDADYNTQDGVQLSDLVYPGQICMGMDNKLWRQMSLQFKLNVPHPSTITETTVELVSSGQNVVHLFVAGHRAGRRRAVRAGRIGLVHRFLSADERDGSMDARGSKLGRIGGDPRAADPRPGSDRPAGMGGRESSGSGLPRNPLEAETSLLQRRVGWRLDGRSGASGYYPNGVAVCLDATGGVDQMRVSREPAAGCPTAPPGGSLEFVFGRVGALRLSDGNVDLGPVRCAGGSTSTTQPIVRVADPEQPAGDASFYLCRTAGSPDFGHAQMSDGTTPARVPGPSACP